MAVEAEGQVIDDVFMSLGWWGFYQKVQFSMSMLPVLNCALHVLSVVFIGRNVPHQCAKPDSLNVTVKFDHISSFTFDVIALTSSNSTFFPITNDNRNNKYLNTNNITIIYGSCSITVQNGTETLYTTSCVNGYDYEQPRENSFVSEWDLVCERESLSDVSQTLLGVGMTVGAFVFPYFADRYGRKPVFMFSHGLLFVTAILTIFCPNFLSFAVIRCFLGAAQQGTGLVSGILLMEMLPTSRRALPSQVGSFFWPGSLGVLCFIAFLTRDVSWRYTQAILAAASGYVLIQWCVMDESLRWLVAKNRFEDAKRVLIKAAKQNKVGGRTKDIVNVFEDGSLNGISTVEGLARLDETLDTTTNNTAEHSMPKDQESETRQMSIFITNRRVFKITAVNCYIWLVDSMTYYGLLMMSSSLADDLYQGFALNVLVDMPAAVMFLLFINRLGRKKCVIVFHIIAGLGLLGAILAKNLGDPGGYPGKTPLVMCLSLLGKFAISTAFAVIFLYSPEQYPTTIRNTGFGIGSMFARIGATVAPYSRTFAVHVPWGPGVVFSSMCLLVPFLCRMLPETRGHELPQKLHEFEKWLEQMDKKKKAKETTTVVAT